MIVRFAGIYCENRCRSELAKHVHVLAINRLRQRCRLRCVFRGYYFSRRKSTQNRVFDVVVCLECVECDWRVPLMLENSQLSLTRMNIRSAPFH
jgi:hypothetical protein